MYSRKKIRFVEPQTRPGRPFNAWARRWPLLGPVMLATILHRRGHDAAVYNENLSGSLLNSPQAMADICAADIVGITAMTPTANRAYQIADHIRSVAPQVKIVFGGVHPTFMPQEALTHGDIVVRGEGESVIESIASGEIAQGVVEAGNFEDLDSLPAPDYELIHDFGQILELSGSRERYELPVMSSRGCPYGCSYCTVTRMFGRRVRRQSVGKVFKDLCHYVQKGFRHFFFYDDNFTSDRHWARQLLERMRTLRTRFNAQVRADFHWADGQRKELDEPLLKAMRRAGGSVLYIGYETIEDSTAKLWHKGYQGGGPLEARLREDTQILHDSGFWIHGMFVMGPQNTASTADRVVDFARRGGIETLQMSILTPFPGTPLMKQMHPHLILRDYPVDWDYYDGAHCVYNHARLGIEGLQRAVLRAHRQFYGWTGWSTRRIRALLEQRVPAWQKLADLWSNAQIARTTLSKWHQETREFLELVRTRTGLNIGT